MTPPLLLLTIMPMEDHRLKAFCLIVEMKSFSKAAAAKYMTQSAISHLIKNLEDELGTRLLNRQGKTVSPTPAGKIFYKRAKEILEQYQKMESDMYSLIKTLKGYLYIGTTSIAAHYLLPQVLYDFSRKYPEVTIDLRTLNTEQIIKELYDGNITIGISEGSINDNRIMKTEIAEDEIVLIASDSNPLTKKKDIKRQDLISQNYIMPDIGSGTRRLVEDFLLTYGLDPQKLNIFMTLDNPELIIQMVQSGIGISFVSRWSVMKSVKEDSVKVLSISGRKLHRKFYLVSFDHESITLVTKTFIDFIKSYKFFKPF